MSGNEKAAVALGCGSFLLTIRKTEIRPDAQAEPAGGLLMACWFCW